MFYIDFALWITQINKAHVKDNIFFQIKLTLKGQDSSPEPNSTAASHRESKRADTWSRLVSMMRVCSLMTATSSRRQAEMLGMYRSTMLVYRTHRSHKTTITLLRTAASVPTSNSLAKTGRYFWTRFSCCRHSLPKGSRQCQSGGAGRNEGSWHQGSYLKWWLHVLWLWLAENLFGTGTEAEMLAALPGVLETPNMKHQP